MARMTLDKGFSVDRKRALVQMSADGKPLAHMVFDGKALEAQIRDLANFRMHMSEPVAELPGAGEALEIERQPVWRLPDVKSGPAEHAVLALRHSGFGWLSFSLPTESALALGRALTERAEETDD